MYYIIYKTTNTINGKIYIGVHSTTNIHDSYLGSGTLLKKAISKYGRNVFQKEILYIYQTLTEALDQEKIIVTADFVKRDDTYNLCLGGGIGGKNINGLTFEGHKHTDITKQKISKAKQNQVISESHRAAISFSSKYNEDRKIKISETMKKYVKTDKHIENISKAMKEYHQNNINKSRKGIKKPRVVCPHCGKDGSPNNIKRWHLENCKTLYK